MTGLDYSIAIAIYSGLDCIKTGEVI